MGRTLFFIRFKTLSIALAIFSVLTACSSGSNNSSSPDDETSDNAILTLRNFQAADVVIGQTDFSESDENQGGSADANTIYEPYGNPKGFNDILYLPDYGNNRVLGFNTIPTVSNMPADFVLGQPDFTSTMGGTSELLFTGPQDVAFDEGKMFLVSYENNRILIWNDIPTTGNIPADIVLGQSDFLSSASSTCDDAGLSSPETIWAADGKLIATDSGNNRVLIWNTIPTTNNTPADIVLGQQDFFHCAQNDTNNDGIADTPSASTLSYPAGVWSDGTRVAVLDNSNSRVLIWNTFPTSNAQPADIVLGQSDFAHNTENDDNQDNLIDASPSERTLNDPYNGIFSNGTQLFIADSDNNRVLIWNTFPTSNFQAADIVLGQSDFVNNEVNDDNQDGLPDLSSSARTLDGPTGIFQVGNKLVVADTENNRYLIYTSE